MFVVQFEDDKSMADCVEMHNEEKEILVPEFTVAYAGMCFTRFMPKDLYAFLHETTAVKMDALGESMRLLYHKYDAGGPLRAITGPKDISRRQTFPFPPSLMRPERFHEFAYMLRSISVSAFGSCMSSLLCLLTFLCPSSCFLFEYHAHKSDAGQPFFY